MLVLSGIESGLNSLGDDTCMDENGGVIISYDSDAVATSCVTGLGCVKIKNFTLGKCVSCRDYDVIESDSASNIIDRFGSAKKQENAASLTYSSGIMTALGGDGGGSICASSLITFTSCEWNNEKRAANTI